MKKIAFIIVMFLFLAPNIIHAEGNYIIRWSLGDFKLGMERYKDPPVFEKPSWEGALALGTIGVEHKKTKIGLEFNPARYRFGYNWFSYENEGWNFFNLNLYWNVFTYKLFQVGPFDKINYMYLTDNDLDWSKVTNTLGIRLGFVSYNPSYHYNLRYFGAECGYKIKDGKSSFYFGLDMDILVLGGLILILFGGA